MVRLSPCGDPCCGAVCEPVTASFDSGARQWASQYFLEEIPEQDPLDSTFQMQQGDVLLGVGSPVTSWKSYRLHPTPSPLLYGSSQPLWELVPGASNWMLYAGGASSPFVTYRSQGTPRRRFGGLPQRLFGVFTESLSVSDVYGNIAQLPYLGCSLFQRTSYLPGWDYFPEYLYVEGCLCNEELICPVCTDCDWEAFNSCCRIGAKILNSSGWEQSGFRDFNGNREWSFPLFDICGSLCIGIDYVAEPSMALILDGPPEYVWFGGYTNTAFDVLDPYNHIFSKSGSCLGYHTDWFLPACLWPLRCEDASKLTTRSSWLVLEYNYLTDQYRVTYFGLAGITGRYGVAWASDFFNRPSSRCFEIGSITLNPVFSARSEIIGASEYSLDQCPEPTLFTSLVHGPCCTGAPIMQRQVKGTKDGVWYTRGAETACGQFSADRDWDSCSYTATPSDADCSAYVTLTAQFYNPNSCP